MYCPLEPFNILGSVCAADLLEHYRAPKFVQEIFLIVSIFTNSLIVNLIFKKLVWIGCFLYIPLSNTNIFCVDCNCWNISWFS